MKNTTATTSFHPITDILSVIMPITACVLATCAWLGIAPWGMPADEIQVLVGCILILTPSVFTKSDFKELELFGVYPHLANLMSMWVYIAGLTLICGGPQCIAIGMQIAMHIAVLTAIVLSGIVALLVTYWFNR